MFMQQFSVIQTLDHRLQTGGGNGQGLHKKVSGCELRVTNSKTKTRNTELETSVKAKSDLPAEQVLWQARVRCLNCG
jgi:hypothetical protein